MDDMGLQPIEGRCGAERSRKCPTCFGDNGDPYSTKSENCPLCGEKTTFGGYCVNYPVKGMTRCRMHGGSTPVGEKNPNFTHGRYSKNMPPRLITRYMEAKSDPDILVLKDEISLIEARLGDLLSRVDSGESGIIWKRLSEAFEAFNVARNQKDASLMMTYLEEMHTLIKKGKSDYAAWNEVSSILELRRKLVESERKRLIQAQQVITVDKVMTLLGAVDNIIRSHIGDQLTIQNIALDIRNLLTD
jgi:hypothetical protein